MDLVLQLKDSGVFNLTLNRNGSNHWGDISCDGTAPAWRCFAFVDDSVHSIILDVDSFVYCCDCASIQLINRLVLTSNHKSVVMARFFGIYDYCFFL